MKHTTDRSIGLRAYDLVRNRDKPLAVQARRMNLDRKIFYRMASGEPPSVYTLQAMAHAGFDIHYILTGFHKGEGGHQ